MPLYEVSILETRELIFEIQADSLEEAESLATDAETDEAVRDQFHERVVNWSLRI